MNTIFSSFWSDSTRKVNSRSTDAPVSFCEYGSMDQIFLLAALIIVRLVNLLWRMITLRSPKSLISAALLSYSITNIKVFDLRAF